MVERGGVDRLIIEIADGGIWETLVDKLGMRGFELSGREPGDPAGDHEIGLERIDRCAQRLQHIGLDQGRRAEQS